MVTPSAPCLICEKHRGVGELAAPILWADEYAVVSHRPPAPETGQAIAGYLFVESRAHVERWQDLSEAQAFAVARVSWTAAQVLASSFATDQVFSAIVGMRVPHFHQHVFVRHPGTPPSVPWHEPDAWDQCPHLGAEALDGFAASLRAEFDAML